MDRSLVVRFPDHRRPDSGFRFSVGILPEAIAQAEQRRQQDGGGGEAERGGEERERRNDGERLQTNDD